MKVKTTYLQMFAHPERIVPPPRSCLYLLPFPLFTRGNLACRSKVV
jgi:hypothetical protein